MMPASRWAGGHRVDNLVAEDVISNGSTAQPFPLPDRAVSSQSMRWYDFHLWVQERLDAAGDFPAAGTQAWFDLPDTDERKWAGALAAADYHVLRVETAQETEDEASQAISAATDWGCVAQQVRDRREFQREHQWARRVS